MRLRVPNKRSLDGAHRLDAAFERPDAAEQLAPLVGRLALAGSRGALASTDAAVAQCRFELTGRQLDARRLRFELGLAGIDPRFVELVRAGASHHPDRPAPTELVLHPVSPAGPVDLRELPWPDDQNPFLNYPGRARDITFRVDADRSITSRMRRAVVTFVRDLGTADIESLADWLAPLEALIEDGAYCLPSPSPTDAVSIYGGVQLFEPDSAEIVIDRFDANEAFWDTLVNMIDGFARAGRPVAEMWLE